MTDIKNNIKLKTFIILGIHVVVGILALSLSSWVPKQSFLLFVCVFGLLAFITMIYKMNYALKFFNMFFYLGFYLKFCFHLIFVYPFSEPIGRFNGEISELIEFFNIASVAALAVIIVSVFDVKWLRKHFNAFKYNDLSCIPHFKKWGKAIFLLLSILFIVIAVINIKLGINVSGLAAVTVLPRPLNALIGFFLSTGFSILVAVFAICEYRQTGKLGYTFFLVLFEGFCSSVSILSRGLFLFHFLPFVVCLYVIRDQLTYRIKHYLLFLMAGLAIFLLSGFLVTKGRSALYDSYNLNYTKYKDIRIFDFDRIENKKDEIESDSEEISAELMRYNDSRRFIFIKNYLQKKIVNNSDCFGSSICYQAHSAMKQLSRLVIDRWIGTEGLMAVISYPEKNIDLIFKSLLRTPKVGEKDIFETMNQSFYPVSNKYVFTSLPGPVAFFYYSGQVYIVFLGMIIFTILLLGLQYIVEFMWLNTFLRLQTAFCFAISFMQFGISPRPMLIAFIMLFLLLISIKVLVWTLCRLNKGNTKL